MRRRRVLAVAGATVVGGLAGCTGGPDPDGASTRSSRTTGTSPSTRAGPTETASPARTTCMDPEFEPATTVRGTANTSREGNLTGFRYDVSVENDGNEPRRVAVRFAERTDAECDPVVFERTYALDPGGQTVIRSPIGRDGRYVLIATVRDGGTAKTRVETHDDGIDSATAYFVRVSGSSVSIDRLLA